MYELRYLTNIYVYNRLIEFDQNLNYAKTRVTLYNTFDIFTFDIFCVRCT